MYALFQNKRFSTYIKIRLLRGSEDAGSNFFLDNCPNQLLEFLTVHGQITAA
jgi:hypothetical protein